MELVRRPGVREALGVGIVATLILTVIVITVLLLTSGGDIISTVSDNAALIGALIALGGVFTTQLVNIALEDNRAHEAALRAYLDQIGNLLLDKNLRRAEKGAEVRTLARAQTLAVLKGLRGDPDRKRILMLFLSEAKLLEKVGTILCLEMADLSKAGLAELGSPLGGDILRKKNLSGSYLNEAKLRKTDLRETNLTGAHLTGADLRSADLSGADMRKAIVTDKQLKTARSLEGAIMPDGSKHD